MTAYAAGDKNGRPLLYESKFRIADVVVHTDRAAALQTFRDAQAIMQQLHGEEPQNGGWAYKLAFITNKVGETLQGGGDFQSAQEQFAIALRIADENAARPSAQAAWRAYPAITRTKIGSLLLARPDRDLPGAMKNFDEAIALLENVHRSFPDNNVIESNLKRAHQSKAEALAGVGRPTEAFKELDVAADIGKQLADKDPGNATWMVGLADVAIIYGDLKKDADPGFASGQFETAASIYRRLLSRDACNPSWREKFEDVRKRLKALEKEVSSLGEAPVCAQVQ